MNKTIGTCSLCGGPVQVATVYYSVVPPEPKCASCGATKADHGPVITMKPAQPRQHLGSAIDTFAQAYLGGRFGGES